MNKNIPNTKKTILHIPVVGEDRKIEIQDKKDSSAQVSLFSQYMRVYGIRARQGNASTKTRSEVRGTTKKIYKQKGTGRARHGDNKAPIFVGGGVVGGPRPHEYEAHLNKRVNKKSTHMALLLRVRQGDVSIISSINELKKTKDVNQLLKKNRISSEKLLVVLSQDTLPLHWKSWRNLSGIVQGRASILNLRDLLVAKHILFEEKAYETFLNRFIEKK